MIVIYTSEGCSSCRKAKQYMKDNHLKFIEKNINKETLKEDEVRYLLKRTENGTQDLISSRSRIIKEERSTSKTCPHPIWSVSLPIIRRS